MTSTSSETLDEHVRVRERVHVPHPTSLGASWSPAGLQLGGSWCRSLGPRCGNCTLAAGSRHETDQSVRIADVRHVPERRAAPLSLRKAHEADLYLREVGF